MKGDANTVRYLLKKEGKRILYVIGINPRNHWGRRR